MKIESKEIRWQVSHSDRAKARDRFAAIAEAAHKKDSLTDEQRFALYIVAGHEPKHTHEDGDAKITTHTTHAVGFEKVNGKWVVLWEGSK